MIRRRVSIIRGACATGVLVGAIVVAVASQAAVAVQVAPTDDASFASTLDESGPGFEHIEQQAQLAASQLAGSDASQHVDAGRVSVALADDSESVVRDYSVDARTGVVRIASRSGEVASVTPLQGPARQRSRVEDGMLVTTPVGADAVEEVVTIPGAESMEQHLVVGEAHASERLERSWKLDVPADWDIAFRGGELRLWERGEIVGSISADYAKDEAGNELPVEFGFDPGSSVMTVAFAGDEIASSGRVAIDPSYEFGGGVGRYRFVICQDADSVPCSQRVDEPIAKYSLESAFPARYVIRANDGAWGPSIGNAAGAEFGASAVGTLRWSVPDPSEWSVVSVRVRATVRDKVAAGPSFACRPRLTFMSGGSVDGPAHSVGNDNEGVTFNDTLSVPAGETLKSFDMRLERIGAESVTTVDAEDIRCWMNQRADPDTGAQRAEVVFTLRDEDPPTVSTMATATADSIQNVVGVVGSPNNWRLADSTGYDEATWYRAGSRVSFGLHASDARSGVMYRGFAFARADGERGDVRGRYSACESLGDWAAGMQPCPASPSVPDFADVHLDRTEAPVEGLNPYWTWASDYAGNDAFSPQQFFLYDSVAPPRPQNVSGGNASPGLIVDAVSAVDVTWDRLRDVGEQSNPRRGSGIATVEGEVNYRHDAGPYVQFKDGHFGATTRVDSPETSFARFDTIEDDGTIPATTEFQYRLRGVDRAGNEGAWSDYQYLRVDTTPPGLSMQQPNLDRGEVAEVRDPGAAVAVKLDATEEIGTDKIDVVGVQQRKHDVQAPGEWATVDDVEDQNPGERPFSLTYPTSGWYDVRGLATDGPHESRTGSVEVCADTTIWPSRPGWRDSWRARKLTVRKLGLGETAAGTRLYVTIPKQSDLHASTRAWIIERRATSASAWRFVGRIGRVDNREQDVVEAYDTFTPFSAAAEFRVSPATLKCTTQGADEIARIGVPDERTDPIDGTHRPTQPQLLGLEPQWTYQDMPLGGGFTSHVNVAVGNHVLTRTLLGEQLAGYDVAASLVYNSQQFADDEQIAESGVVGSQWHVSIGEFGAPEGSLRIADKAALLVDGDGTRHAFATRDGIEFDSPPDFPYRLRRAEADVAGVHHDYELVDSDGMTYWFVDSHGPQTSRMAPLVMMSDRFGTRVRFDYDCVGVVYDVKTNALGAANPDGSACTTPASDATTYASVDRRLRTVDFGGGRTWTLSYAASGQLRSLVRSSGVPAQDRTVELQYANVGSEQLPAVSAVVDTAGDGASRRVEIGYAASLLDPASWFTDRTLVESITDYRKHATRFSYRVPDLGNQEWANPRVWRVQNREDVHAGDGLGVAYSYKVTDAGRLAGVNSIEDQQGRRTTYGFVAGLADPNFGLVTEITEPSGLVTSIDRSDTADKRTVTTTQRVDAVRSETVRLVGAAPSMLLNGPPVPGSVHVTEAGKPVTDVIVRADGQVVNEHGTAKDERRVRVSYESARTSTDVVRIARATGRVESSEVDQSQTRLPSPALEGDSRVQRAVTTFEWGGHGAIRDGGPAWTVPVDGFVQNLKSVESPGRRVTKYDVAAGRVVGVHAPFGSGDQRSDTTYTYFPSGRVYRIDYPNGSSQLMWQYDAYGEPQRVTSRISSKTADAQAQPARDDESSGDLEKLPHVETQRDTHAQVTCVRDRRGPRAYGNRYVTMSYDSWGRLVRETTPYRTRPDGTRLRRVSVYEYDANDNLRLSTVDAVYERGGDASTDCDDDGSSGIVEPGVRAPGLATDESGAAADTTYDRLDRVTTSRLLSNSDEDRPRVAATTYSRAGDVVRVVEPRGVATAQGDDYTTTTVYDDAGRPAETIDGSGLHSCAYYSAFGEVVLSVDAHTQGRRDCPDTPLQGHATRSLYDAAGRLAWQQRPGGRVTQTIWDEESNARTVAQRVGVAGDAAWRVTDTDHGVGGVVLRVREPVRMACVTRRLGACSSKSLKRVRPTTSYEYDAMNQVARVERPRSSVNDAADWTSYARDFDGRVQREAMVDGAGRAVSSITRYTPFGEVSLVTLPMLSHPAANAPDAEESGFVTRFAYGDDGSLVEKDDVAHDNRVSWAYDGRGNMVERVEHGAKSGPGREWEAVQRYSWYDDASKRTEPASVPKYEPGVMYARGACVRQPSAGEDPDDPTWVYQVDTWQAQVKGPQKIRWSAFTDTDRSRWVDTARKMKLTKLRGSDVKWSWDENGQLASVSQCGNTIEYSRRSNTGEPLEARDMFGHDVHYEYDDRMRLVQTRFESGYSQKLSYGDLEPRAGVVDPSVGMVSDIRLRNDQAKENFVGVRYAYDLDGSVRRVERLQARRPVGDAAREVIAGTEYSLDAAGLVSSFETYRVGASGGRERIAGQSVVRDVAGNARRVAERAALVMSDGSYSELRSRVRQWAYDPQGRVESDKLGGGNPRREYTYDPHARLEAITAVGVATKKNASARVVLDRYVYGNDARMRGVMLATAHDATSMVGVPLARTHLYYGNGRTGRGERVGSVAGPRGQLVLSDSYAGVDRDVDAHVSERYVLYSRLGQLQQATTREYVKVVRACVPARSGGAVAIAPAALRALRSCPKGWSKQEPTDRERERFTHSVQRAHRLVLVFSRTGRVMSERASYDALGRQFQSTRSEDSHPDDGSDPVSWVERRYYAGADEDPVNEVDLGARGDVQSRWTLRGVDGTVVGERRDTRTRYLIADLQNSTRMTIDGSAAARLTATFDYDTFGAAYNKPDTKYNLSSGTTAEHDQNVIGYTGMHTRPDADTTNHHARDYDAALRTWLQTDQYTDPWQDLGLSLDPSTRDRHAYAGGNPVGMVDVDGHRPAVDCGGSKSCAASQQKADRVFFTQLAPKMMATTSSAIAQGQWSSSHACSSIVCNSTAPTVLIVPEELASHTTSSPPNASASPPVQGNFFQRWGQRITGTNYADNDDFWSATADAGRVGAFVFSLGLSRGATAAYRATLPEVAVTTSGRAAATDAASGTRLLYGTERINNPAWRSAYGLNYGTSTAGGLGWTSHAINTQVKFPSRAVPLGAEIDEVVRAGSWSNAGIGQVAYSGSGTSGRTVLVVTDDGRILSARYG